MHSHTDDSTQDQTEMDATAEQLAELRRFGIAEKELEGLSSTDAEEWIDELRTQRRDARRFGRPGI